MPNNNDVKVGSQINQFITCGLKRKTIKRLLCTPVIKPLSKKKLVHVPDHALNSFQNFYTFYKWTIKIPTCLTAGKTSTDEEMEKTCQIKPEKEKSCVEKSERVIKDSKVFQARATYLQKAVKGISSFS